MLKAFITLLLLAFAGLAIAFVISSGALSLALRMMSRVFVSGRRRPTPTVRRGGGLVRLPEDLAGLVRSQRQLEAAITDLRELSPTYHRSSQIEHTGIRDDRRHQALRRDYEDAVIHATRAMDQWRTCLGALDPRGRARLETLGSVPDVHGVLEDFRWLPRHVYQVGHLHFRSDQEAFERRLFALGDQLRPFEEALTYERTQAYR
ncbi:MAG: hypothetical protein AAGF11_05335 [Myxococcota bacterium]